MPMRIAAVAVLGVFCLVGVSERAAASCAKADSTQDSAGYCWPLLPLPGSTPNAIRDPGLQKIDPNLQQALLTQAPIHIQARIVEEPLAPETNGDGEVEAVIMRSFKGGDLLPPGRHFRINMPRITPNIDGGTRSANSLNYQNFPRWSGLQRGVIFEAFLNHAGPPDAFALAGELDSYGPAKRFKILPSATPDAQLVIPPPPAGFDMSMVKYTTSMLNARDLPSVPPAFPTRDVTVEFRTRWGEGFRAYYQARTWRTRLESTGPGADASNYTLIDHFGDFNLVVSSRLREYQPSSLGSPFGDLPYLGINRKFIPLHEEANIAGLKCEIYLAPGVNLCVTDDGVVLSKTFDGRSDTTVEKVTYGQLSDALFEVPHDYTMKRLPPSSD